eukprot:Hpha_TRINITY_DN15798_c2_g7::TRINITY_DN15798_c2_g7_i1::g.40463::m.40463
MFLKSREFESEEAVLVLVVLQHWGAEGIPARTLALLRQVSRRMNIAVLGLIPCMQHTRQWPWWPRPFSEMDHSCGSPRKLNSLVRAHQYEDPRSLWEKSGLSGLRWGSEKEYLCMSYHSLQEEEDAWRLASVLWHDETLHCLDLSFTSLSTVSLMILTPALASMKALEHLALQGNPPISDSLVSSALAGAVRRLASLRSLLLPEGAALRSDFAPLAGAHREDTDRWISVNFVYG